MCTFFHRINIFRFPSQEALFTIYSSILNQHLKNPVNKFNNSIILLADIIVQLAIDFHSRILTIFLPTAIKFHYIFNLRDMSNVFQVKSYFCEQKTSVRLTGVFFFFKGLMFANGDCVSTTVSFIRLWYHETSRIYADKLIEKKDQELFTKTIVEQIKKAFMVNTF